MLSRLLFALINNLRVVEKLAESRPIRRAAQLTAYAITKAQLAGRGASRRLLPRDGGGDLGEVGQRLNRVRQTFVNEVKAGWKEGSRQVKK